MVIMKYDYGELFLFSVSDCQQNNNYLCGSVIIIRTHLNIHMTLNSNISCQPTTTPRYATTNIPLDRITSISPAKETYVDSAIEWDEYFDDVIGVTLTDEKPEKIVLRFSAKQYPYIKSKPIHGSMKMVSDDEGIVSINVIPNYELEALIGSFSNDVEVISPQWLREKIANNYRELAELYSK